MTDHSKSKAQLITELNEVYRQASVQFPDKKVDEVLRENQKQFSGLIENLPGIAYRCKKNSDWTMEFVNFDCESLTGYKPEELSGNKQLSFTKLIHPEDKQMVWDNIQKALDERQSFQTTYRVFTSSGKEKWVLEQGRGIFGTENELIAIEGFITDIDDHKQVEKEHQMLIKKVENNLAQFNINQKKLVEIESLKSVQELSGAVSHEFSQPLQALTNYLELIKEVGPKPEYLSQCHSMINRVTELINHLKGVSSLKRKNYVDTKIIDLKNSSSKEKRSFNGDSLTVDG